MGIFNKSVWKIKARNFFKLVNCFLFSQKTCADYHHVHADSFTIASTCKYCRETHSKRITEDTYYLLIVHISTKTNTKTKAKIIVAVYFLQLKVSKSWYRFSTAFIEHMFLPPHANLRTHTISHRAKIVLTIAHDFSDLYLSAYIESRRRFLPAYSVGHFLFPIPLEVIIIMSRGHASQSSKEIQFASNEQNLFRVSRK